MSPRWAARAGLASLLVASLASACRGADHEREADRAYAEGRFADALGAYRGLARAHPGAPLWAKVGAAALHANELREAADAYLRLAGDDPTRADEAAEGLEAVARAAERAGNGDVLREVVSGLQAMAPERATGRYALTLALQPQPDTAELVALLPGALAAATAPETIDTLLTLYGHALAIDRRLRAGAAAVPRRPSAKPGQQHANPRAPWRRRLRLRPGCPGRLGREAR